MKKIHEAIYEFDGTQEDAKRKLICFQEIRCHMIFDVKMEGLVRKVWFVAGGHTTKTPQSLTFASVVTRESVRLGFLIAAMNELEIVAADVRNTYLNADCWEKIWFIASPAFATKKGKVLIMCKALYGLKSSGAAWRVLFSSTLHELGYMLSKGNPDVYLRPAVKVKYILHITHHKALDHGGNREDLPAKRMGA
jgi:Reverse transcriptase (RNA-dependent DNA polymerase)